MRLHSSLADFSLAELFLFIAQGRKTCRLIVCNLSSAHASTTRSRYYSIWFRHGCVVAASNCLNGQGLLRKIKLRKWLHPQLLDQFCTQQSQTPLGLRLKASGLLDTEHLNLLFASQLKHIQEMFEFRSGVFKLDKNLSAPTTEMTGLTLEAIEAALMALRSLKNWQTLADVLPDPNSAICTLSDNQPHVHLKDLERQILTFANSRMSLNNIATIINQPTTSLQQATFRLIIAGLVEEVYLMTPQPPLNHHPIDLNLLDCSHLAHQPSPSLELGNLSDSLFNNAVGYLKRKL